MKTHFVMVILIMEVTPPPKTNVDNFKTRNIDKVWFGILITTLISCSLWENWSNWIRHASVNTPQMQNAHFRSSQGQCHNLKMFVNRICCHFGHFMKCNMVLDCFRMYCLTFETYFTVDCTRLLVKNKHQIFNFLDDSFNQTVMEHV